LQVTASAKQVSETCCHTWQVQASSVGAKGFQAAVKVSWQGLQDSQQDQLIMYVSCVSNQMLLAGPQLHMEDFKLSVPSAMYQLEASSREHKHCCAAIGSLSCTCQRLQTIS
jgi:hypothetical protein